MTNRQKMGSYTDDEFIRACEDEIQALNEIFPDDVTDLRRLKYDENGTYIAPKLTIILRPQESRLNDAQTDYYEAGLSILRFSKHSFLR